MILDLELPPRLTKSADPYAWADYVELLCLVNVDGEVSLQDLLVRIRDGGNRASDDDAGGEDAAPARDDWHQAGTLWFKHLARREETFGEFYPFKVDTSENFVVFDLTPTDKQLFYIFLLVASNFPRIDNAGGIRNTLAADFEVLSKEVLSRCMPAAAKVYIMGSSNKQSSNRYSGNERTKLKKLASDLKENLIAREKDSRPTSTGDGGLDLVGWLPMGDEEPGLPIVFGQCACTKKDWKKKQHSISTDVWDRKIPLTAPPYRMVFIPICFRGEGGDWYDEGDVYRGTILIDRVRFTYLVNCGHKKLSELPSAKIIETILGEKEPLF